MLSCSVVDTRVVVLTFVPLISLSCSSQAERIGLRNRIEKKTAYLKELEDQVRLCVWMSINHLNWHCLTYLCHIKIMCLGYIWFSFFKLSWFSPWIIANTLLPLFKFIDLKNLVQRNEQLYGSGNAPSGGVTLPFILVQVFFLT